ncbi:MAG: MBL fold metallo-hydrolase [Fusobacteriaceae bacterium]
MNIKNFYLGIYMTNCYLTWDDAGKGYLFDCGGEDLSKIKKFVEEKGINLQYVVLTHGHYDHIGGIKAVENFFPEVEIFIGEEDKDFLENSDFNLSHFIDSSYFSYSGKINFIKNGEYVGDFIVIDTPGHTIGSKCFYHEASKTLISGDTLFRRSFGRTDFPTGNTEMLYDSLKKICLTLPDDTKIFSGHSETTTIAEEREFLKGMGII